MGMFFIAPFFDKYLHLLLGTIKKPVEPGEMGSLPAAFYVRHQAKASLVGALSSAVYSYQDAVSHTASQTVPSALAARCRRLQQAPQKEAALRTPALEALDSDAES